MYDNNRMADPTFGLNSQALAVLQVLAQREPDFATYNKEINQYEVSFNTWPWYNGRERGICVGMTPVGLAGKTLNIAVFEHRNSDQLCCLNWETDSPYWNCPNSGDWQATLDKAYEGDNKHNVTSFAYLAVGDCVNWIYETFSVYYINARIDKAPTDYDKSVVFTEITEEVEL